MAIIALTQRPRLTQNGDAVLDTLPLTLDDHDPRVTAAKAAEKQLYDFYGISYTIRQIMLPRYGITVRITATGEGDPVVIVPGNTGDGFPFIPGYKNWRAISSTDRFDNRTMRVILGNDVTIKAIAEHHINPWPDGAAFAKVTWLQQPDDKGFVHTGAFAQVELMLKDSHKYAATAGWGWGRWRGDDLKPYGKDAAFSGECVSCHTPVRDNDFVYTMPLKGQQ